MSGYGRRSMASCHGLRDPVHFLPQGRRLQDLDGIPACQEPWEQVLQPQGGNGEDDPSFRVVLPREGAGRRVLSERLGEGRATGDTNPVKPFGSCRPPVQVPLQQAGRDRAIPPLHQGGFP